MKRLALVLPFLIPAALSAQSGSIEYDYAVRNGFTIPPRMDEALKKQIPLMSVSPMLLVFKDAESRMSSVPSQAKPATSDDRGTAMVMRLKTGSVARADHERVVASYVSPDGTMTEQRDFMGRSFLITEKRPVISWKLTGEQSSFLNYPVQRATAQVDSTKLDAWFAPSIPVSGGPAGYAGLPGMILVVSVDSGRVAYTATKVQTEAGKGTVLSAPTEGTRVSRAEYERIVADKLKELLLERRRDGR